MDTRQHDVGLAGVWELSLERTIVWRCAQRYWRGRRGSVGARTAAKRADAHGGVLGSWGELRRVTRSETRESSLLPPNTCIGHDWLFPFVRQGAVRAERELL